MAVGASDVLDTARVYADLKAGLGDLHLVYATTARERGVTKEVLSPEEAVRRLRLPRPKGRRPASCSATSAPGWTTTRSRSPTR